MKHFVLLCAVLLATLLPAWAELLPSENFPSKVLGGIRTIRIYLPPSYKTEQGRRYPVLYLHDGQNVFSSAGTNCCFGWGAWNLDLTADELVKNHKMAEIIMVGIDSGAERLQELGGVPGMAFDGYTSFLTQELKPYIDGRFRTQTAAEHTAVMGSSMGGIGSLAIGWKHPEVFGGVASLSGAYQINNATFLQGVLGKYVGAVKPLKIYLDCGVVDFTGGDDNHALNAQVAKQLERIGWQKTNLLFYVDAKPMGDVELAAAGLRHDKWKEAKTSQHNEFYWRQRSGRALVFLFPP